MKCRMGFRKVARQHLRRDRNVNLLYGRIPFGVIENVQPISGNNRGENGD